MFEDDGSEADAPQGTMDDEARNDRDGESSQKSESSEEPCPTLRVNEKKPRYTQPPPAKQIRIPKSGAARKSKGTGGREADPMEPKWRREPPPTLQGVNPSLTSSTTTDTQREDGRNRPRGFKYKWLA